MQIRGGALQKAPPSKTILISVHVEGTGPESILLVLITRGADQNSFEVMMVNEEIKNRIRLSVAAYAYEYKDDPVMSDAEFDELSQKINPTEKTGNRKLDNFFKKHFQPDTGMWVRRHPEKNKLDYIYRNYYDTNSTLRGVQG